LADVPDVWDVNISDWSNDSATARFEPDEGYQEQYTAFVKRHVTKPVVGVGRFTSPTAMLSQIERGVLDFIGAARPSIADPFLPNKIRDGELESIRECIGCNICVSSDNVVAPIRCTQNPVMGEEWKRDWHPEFSKLTESPEQTLVVGAGPAGLECGFQLSRRGYPVMLAEAGSDTGGRLLLESTLPGLASYRRVRDYRHQQLITSQYVEVLLGNQLSAAEIADTGIQHVFVATGARWCRDARGREHPNGVELPSDGIPVLTPDDVLPILSGTGTNAGVVIKQATTLNAGSGHMLVYDDDHYYMGGVIAEALLQAGNRVTLVTPASCVSAWTEHTLEQHRIQSHLLRLGVAVVTTHRLTGIDDTQVGLQCIYSERRTVVQADAIVLVTSRLPNDALLVALDREGKFDTLQAVGDCHAPSTVAAAVYSGHLAARSLHADEDIHLFHREQPAVNLKL